MYASYLQSSSFRVTQRYLSLVSEEVVLWNLLSVPIVTINLKWGFEYLWDFSEITQPPNSIFMHFLVFSFSFFFPIPILVIQTPNFPPQKIKFVPHLSYLQSLLPIYQLDPCVWVSIFCSNKQLWRGQQ